MPVRATAAIATRAVQRGRQVLANVFHKKLAGNPDTYVKEVISILDRIAIASSKEKNPSGVLPRNLECTDKYVQAYVELPAGSAELSVFLAATAAARFVPHMLNNVEGSLRGMGFKDLPGPKRDRLDRMFSSAYYADCKHVLARLKSKSITKVSPCPPESMGKLWPNGEPDWEALS